jgi:predicted AAA+ superfamily ATPase
MIPRPRLLSELDAALGRSPIVALTGPRQCGKTTLARAIAGNRPSHRFDLEDPVDERRLATPKATLEALRGLVVIDEVQRRPDLLPVLRVLADREPPPARFLLLGSASPDLVRGASETLAGRVAFVAMSGFSLEEVGTAERWRLWLRGGFPRSYLAQDDAASLAWREDFIQTFLERDLRNLGFDIPPMTLRRLWMMLAHWHGGILNASELGRSLGSSHTNVRRHVDLLSGALVVRQLLPWFENVSKRQVKSAKVYVRDQGLLHSLLGIGSRAELEGHPKLGSSWEGLVIEEAIRVAGERNAYFWGTPAGAELDLLLFVRGKRIGVEAKYADAPGLTRSMHSARHDLGLRRILVVYPGSTAYALDERCDVIPLSELRERLQRE